MTEVQKSPQNQKERERSIDTVLAFCEEMIELLHLEVTVEGKKEGEIIQINLTGADRPYLLSNSASLLNNLEYLMNKVFRSSKGEAFGIALDSDNYRQHREAELILLAQMASKKVISFRKPLSLQPMIPRERRIVHLALADIEGVRTKSDGDGDNRSITIYPS